MYSKKELVEISKYMLEQAGIEVVRYGEYDIDKEEVDEVTDKILKMVKSVNKEN